MRRNGILVGLALLAAGCSREPPPAAAAAPPPHPVAKPQPQPDVMPAFTKKPNWLGQKYLNEGEFQKLESLVEDLVTRKALDDDGRPELYQLEKGLQEFFEIPRSSGDTYVQRKLQAWKTEIPASAYRPIVVAIEMHTAAWRARGNGFASTVTEEGWKLFRERNHDAWRILVENRQASSRIPSWYSTAIDVGIDADVSMAEMRDIFNEGIARHPGYLPIYFAYMRDYSPRWGGTFAEADKFIREQVAAPNNVIGEVLYTRLYWVLDQNNGQEPSLFEESLVSWPRMRKGFEQMMQQFPESEWNRANFASYACRARDATSYGLVRPKVQAVAFEDAAPHGISLDVCDARFMKKT